MPYCLATVTGNVSSLRKAGPKEVPEGDHKMKESQAEGLRGFAVGVVLKTRI